MSRLIRFGGYFLLDPKEQKGREQCSGGCNFLVSS